MTKKSKHILSLRTTFFVYIFILTAWTFYRFIFHFSDNIDTLVFKPLIWFIPIITAIQQAKTSFKFQLKVWNLKIMLVSIGVGVGLALLQLIPRLLNNNIKLQSLLTIPNISIILVPFFTAVIEEIVFRGFILQQLKSYYSPIVANIITSLLFVLIHIPILVLVYSISGLSLPMGLYIIFVNSFFFGLLYQKTENLGFPIIAHFINNLLLSLV